MSTTLDWSRCTGLWTYIWPPGIKILITTENVDKLAILTWDMSMAGYLRKNKFDSIILKIY